MRATPDDAYRFARGEPLVHPAGHTMQLRRPLDFQAVTDHGILLGVLPAMDDPEDPLYDVPLARELRELGPAEGFQRGLRAYRGGEFLEIDGSEANRSAWQRIVESAERNNDPGAFTTFIGYEYTTVAADQGNLHRNVIFRGSEAPEVPFTAMDSDNPEDLWAWLDTLRAGGTEAFAIPHNSNGSNGNMFSLMTFGGDPLDAEYVETRMRNEPLVEVTQVKGTSEVHPLLSPNDEWADFEIMPHRIATTLYSEPKGSYVRTAYLDGLLLEETRGFNPFPFRPRRRHRHTQRRRHAGRGRLSQQGRQPGRHAATSGLGAAGRVQRGRLPRLRPDLLPQLGRLRPDRRLGRGEHAGLDLRRLPSQGDPSPPRVRGSRCASSAATTSTRTWPTIRR